MSETFGQKVRALRMARGWSAKDLAREAVTSERCIHHVEADRNLPSLLVFANLAFAFGVTLDALYKHDSDRLLRALELFTDRLKRSA